MVALNRAGFANISTSRHPSRWPRSLRDCYIAATVRCARPRKVNKPLPDEIAACADPLDAGSGRTPRLNVVVALGKIAQDAWFRTFVGAGHSPPRHGESFGPGGIVYKTQQIDRLLPSRRMKPRIPEKVTAPMYDEVFALARKAWSEVGRGRCRWEWDRRLPARDASPCRDRPTCT